MLGLAACDDKAPDAPPAPRKAAKERAPDVATAPPEISITVPDYDDAKPQLAVSPTKNYLPAELEGITMGMKLEAFRAKRDPKRLEVVHAFHESKIPNVDGTETDKQFMEKLDDADKNRARVDSPDWPGTEGLYYLRETFEDSPIQRAEFTFNDGILKRAIVYYDSPDAALTVAKGLLGKEATADARWSKPRDGDNPPLSAWAYEDRYVLRYVTADKTPAADGKR